MLNPQFLLDIRPKLIGDLFAGGGGASCGIEQATGLYVDFAINHDREAIAMHTANHPQTRHYLGDVYDVDPHTACGGRPIGLLHLSPDCTHHSQAAGGQPRDTATRSLSWVGVRYAGQVRPDVITLENVEQIRKWGPLVAKRDPATGRVIKRDRSIAAAGEVVPVQEQYLVPCKKKQGRTWRRFIRTLENMGYTVEHRVLVAADYGAPTTRKRLYMIARCDGEPIIWPTPTHAEKPAKGQKKWRSAAECIDFENTGQSIFERKKPLAENTLRRIAKGVQKFVLDSDEPFIVKFRGDSGGHNINEPLPTITSGGNAKRPAGAAHALGLATPVLAPANGGFNTVPGRNMAEPMSTITNSGSQQQLIAACLMRQFGTSSASDIGKPMGTVMTGGSGKTGLIECSLGKTDVEQRAIRVANFLINYYGNGDARAIDAPLDTITTRDRLALVTVYVKGEPHYIVDIRLRMLTPAELYKAQGFPADYIFEHDHTGQPLTKTAQVRMCGNSVSPPVLRAIIDANYKPDSATQMAA